MKIRPLSITVIAWVLIVMGLIAIGLTPLAWNVVLRQRPYAIEELMARSSIPLPVQNVLSLLGALVTLASGVGVFYGRSWGRVLYVAWSVIRFLPGLATSPMKWGLVSMAPGLVLFSIVAFFLFRKSASLYFGETERSPIPETAAPDGGGQDVCGLTDERFERRNLRWHRAGVLLALCNLAAVFLGVVVDVPVVTKTPPYNPGDRTWVAGVELATAREPPAQPRIWGRRPAGVDPSHSWVVTCFGTMPHFLAPRGRAGQPWSRAENRERGQ